MMNVQCAICDAIHTYDDDSITAKKLKNRWIRTYLCPKCDERIRVNTKKRLETGSFIFHKERKKPFLPVKDKES